MAATADLSAGVVFESLGKTRKFLQNRRPRKWIVCYLLFSLMELSDGYHEQLQRDSPFLCSDQKMDTELVDKLVLQLNRIYPQILSDKEAQKFRDLTVPTKVRLAELLVHLQEKGEDACHEFYRGLHIYAEDIYFSLPTRVRRRETADAVWTNKVAGHRERYVLNDRGPLFFLSCFSLAVGLAMFYYYGEVKVMRGPGSFLQYSRTGQWCQ